MVTPLFAVLTAANESGNVRQRVNGHNSRGLLHRAQPQAVHTADPGFTGSGSSEIRQNHYRRPVTSVTVYGQQQQQQRSSPPDWTPIADGVAVAVTSGTTTSDSRPDRYRHANVAKPEAEKDRRFLNVDANAIIINDLLRGHDLNANFDLAKIETYRPKNYENTIFPDKYHPRTYTANTVHEPRQNYNQNSAESNLHRGYYHHQQQQQQQQQHVLHAGENNKHPVPAQNNVTAAIDPSNVYQLGQRLNFDDVNSIIARHRNGHVTVDESKHRQIFKTNATANYKPNFADGENDIYRENDGQNSAYPTFGVEYNRPRIFSANSDDQRSNSSHENRYVNTNDVKVGGINEPFPRISNASSDGASINAYRSRNSNLNSTWNQFRTNQNIAVIKDNDNPNVHHLNVDDNKRYVFRTTDSNRSTSVPNGESSNIGGANGTVHRYGYHGYGDAENDEIPRGNGGDRRRDDDATAATVVAKSRRAPSVAADREVIERRRSSIDAAVDSTATVPEFSTATAVFRQRSSTVQPRRRTAVAARRQPSGAAHEANGDDRLGPPKNGRNHRVRNVSAFSE